MGEGCWGDLSSSLLLCLGRSREDLSALQIGPRAAPWLGWFLLVVAIINKITGPCRTFTCFGASVGRPIPVLNDVPIKEGAPSSAPASPPSHTPTHLVSGGTGTILVTLTLVVVACQKAHGLNGAGVRGGWMGSVMGSVVGCRVRCQIHFPFSRGSLCAVEEDLMSLCVYLLTGL